MPVICPRWGRSRVTASSGGDWKATAVLHGHGRRRRRPGAECFRWPQRHTGPSGAGRPECTADPPPDPPRPAAVCCLSSDRTGWHWIHWGRKSKRIFSSSRALNGPPLGGEPHLQAQAEITVRGVQTAGGALQDLLPAAADRDLPAVSRALGPEGYGFRLPGRTDGSAHPEARSVEQGVR